MDYSELSSMIDQLDALVNEESPGKGYWKEVWSLVGSVGSGFKGAKCPSANDRDEMWGRYQKIISSAERRSEEAKQLTEKNEAAFERKKYFSRQWFNEIQDMARAVNPSGDELLLFIASLVFPPTILAVMAIESITTEETKFEDSKRELISRSSVLSNAWRYFKDNKHEMLPGDRNDAYNSLTNAREILDSAWEEWKQRKEKFYEGVKRQREEFRAEKERKKKDFIRRVEANITKLEDKLENAKNSLHKSDAHISKLETDYSNAWNDGFRDRCSEWISAANERNDSIRESIDRIKGWLDEERGKLK